MADMVNCPHPPTPPTLPMWGVGGAREGCRMPAMNKEKWHNLIPKPYSRFHPEILLGSENLCHNDSIRAIF